MTTGLDRNENDSLPGENFTAAEGNHMPAGPSAAVLCCAPSLLGVVGAQGLSDSGH